MKLKKEDGMMTKRSLRLLPRMALAMAAALVSASRPIPAQDDVLSRPIVLKIPGMDSVDVTTDVTYRTADGMDLRMDIYAPPALQATW